jgi:hypothetical protein
MDQRSRWIFHASLRIPNAEEAAQPPASNSRFVGRIRLWVQASKHYKNSAHEPGRF